MEITPMIVKTVPEIQCMAPECRERASWNLRNSAGKFFTCSEHHEQAREYMRNIEQKN